MARKRPSREARMRKKRQFLLETQRYRCFYCGCFLAFEVATVDHLLPQSLGGGDHIENLAAACAPRNSRRGSRSVREMLRLTAPMALNNGIVLNMTPQPLTFRPFETLSRALTSVWEGVKKMFEFHWSRAPGKFVNKLTGKPVVLSSSLSLGPVFTGSVREWYETLVETMKDLAASEFSGCDEIDVFVSADVAVILECSMMYTPRFVDNIEQFNTDGGSIKGSTDTTPCEFRGQTYVPRPYPSLNVRVDQNTIRNVAVFKDPKSGKTAALFIHDMNLI